MKNEACDDARPSGFFTISRLVLAICAGALFTPVVGVYAQSPSPAPSGHRPSVIGRTVDVGATGFANRRPVFASACPQTCPWGELGDFIQAAMRPLGYDVILCRNCNRAEGPRVVASASMPPPLDEGHLATGTTERVNAPVDFGVTESGMLNWAFNGRELYSRDGPYRNLRLIARIEDPTYLLAAVKRDSPVTELAEIARNRLPLRILTDMEPTTLMLLAQVGLSKEEVESWGGTMTRAHRVTPDTEFDLIVSSLASPALNPESAYWTTLSQHHDIRFLDIPQQALDHLVRNGQMRHVVARRGLIRGLDRDLPTVGRSGEAFFTRDDIPEQAAYDVARAIDQNRNALIWFVRPFSYDPRTVTSNFDVPLHPGAARYYRESGYLP